MADPSKTRELARSQPAGMHMPSIEPIERQHIEPEESFEDDSISEISDLSELSELSDLPETLRDEDVTASSTVGLGAKGQDGGSDPKALRKAYAHTTMVLKYKLATEREKRKAAEAKLKIAELRAAAGKHTTINTSSRHVDADADPKLLPKTLDSTIYNPNFDVDEAMTQFDHRVRDLAKPRTTLTGIPTHSAWRTEMKARILEADCWELIEEHQIANPFKDTEWAPLWEQKNLWLFSYIWSSLSVTVAAPMTGEDGYRKRNAYCLWRALEEKYAISMTQLRREAVVGFLTVAASTQVNYDDDDDVRAFFDRFRDALAELKAVDVNLPESVVFDVFYSALSGWYQNYVQMKVEEVQVSKSTTATLDVFQLMDEIRAHYLEKW
ncbi:hypothetical protein EMPG_17882 [Blastomyces silverae]|uniref:Uncharacterized protein n=1 Tax=Blastomyces silverae TaxID=2060906 RepID=A0A0H1B6A6_9EURO|nr:hypothetical protein EMPG_17882 [Blastomyces silverae]